MSELTEADVTIGTEIVFRTPNHDITTEDEYYPPVQGEIVDIVEETTTLGPNSTMEKTLVLVETDDGEETRLNINAFSEDSDIRTEIVSEDDDEDDDEDDTDGGEDVAEHVDDQTIEDAIDQHDDTDHPDALTVEEVRDILANIQESVEAMWGEWVDNIERGHTLVISETDDLIIMDTGERNIVKQEMQHHPEIEDDEIAVSVVTQIMHEIARDETDRNWGTTYPFAAVKSGDFGDGQEYVEAVMNALQSRGLTPGQAWAWYGVEIRGNSMASWGKRKGDYDHKNVSDALQKAREKRPN